MNQEVIDRVIDRERKREKERERELVSNLCLSSPSLPNEQQERGGGGEGEVQVLVTLTVLSWEIVVVELLKKTLSKWSQWLDNGVHLDSQAG